MLGVQLCEKLLLFMKKTGQRQEKLKPRWEHGIMVRIRRRSYVLMIPTRRVIVYARSSRSIPEERMWTLDSPEWVQHAPWHRYRGAEDADGDIP